MGSHGGRGSDYPHCAALLFRSRYRTLPWAAMKFLLQSIEQTSRRLKFQELLLLLLRVAVLLLLALVLTRPTLFAGKALGRRDAVDAVFIMDVSYSMSAHAGNKPAADSPAEDAFTKELNKIIARKKGRPGERGAEAP